MLPSYSADAVAIRPARRSDVPAILALLAEDSLSTPPESGVPCAAHYATFDAIAAREDHELMVGTIGDEVMATLQISFIPGLSQQGAWRAQVEAVRVRTDARSRGIGAAMMRWVIARAKERGCPGGAADQVIARGWMPSGFMRGWDSAPATRA